MKKLIGVIGGSDCDKRTADIAYSVGKKIARAGFGIVTGGLGGVMEAASKGCKEAGGVTVGIIMQEEHSYANQYIDIVIPTGMGIARNILVVRTALGIIAINGRFGTLSEISFALQIEKPIIGINTWDISEKIMHVTNPEQAVKEIIKRIIS